MVRRKPVDVVCTPHPTPIASLIEKNKITSIECLVNEQEAAAALRLSVKTLRRWRWMKTGPPWYRIGAAVRYAPSDLEAFKAAGRVVPETDHAAVR
jgi:hypothetical protein